MSDSCAVVESVDVAEGWWGNLINSIFWTYLLSLGEFNYGDFEGVDQAMFLWVLFLVATWILQLGFLNLVVTIMGSAYEKVNDLKLRYQLDVQPDIYANYFKMLPKNMPFNKYSFVYCISFNTVEEEDDWNGGVQTLKRLITKERSTIQKSVQDSETKTTNLYLSLTDRIEDQQN